ncbi:DUF2975 domain-containing protein [Roseibium sp. M-1]
MTASETADRQKRLTRIRRVSAFMKWAVSLLLLVALGLGVTIVIGITLPEEMMIGADETIEIASTERLLGDVPQVQRIGLAILLAFAVSFLMAAGWNMRQVFKRFQQMEFFSPRTLANVISFGVWLIVFAVYDLVSDPIASVIATYDLPPGERAVDITVDGGEFSFMILGALMLLFGWILREAALIADENQQFI